MRFYRNYVLKINLKDFLLIIEPIVLRCKITTHNYFIRIKEQNKVRIKISILYRYVNTVKSFQLL